MKSARILIYLFVFALLPLTSIAAGEYTLVISGYDWGPAVNKVILNMGESVSGVSGDQFQVTAIRTSPCFTSNLALTEGTRDVLFAYVSDARGNRVSRGEYITLVMTVGPEVFIGSPMQFFYNDNCRGTNWVDYSVTVTNDALGQVWDTEVNRIMPIIDEFDLTKSYTHGESLTMAYADFEPKLEQEKYPLIIWLHGGGEGGTDPTLPLMANKASNYASDEIQTYFGGAYVLVPQCPGAWMHNSQGISTRGKENDVYNEGLMALIKDYVANHPDIDTSRIYLGGCSNGGYMTVKLMLLYPDYFAAGFVSALAYDTQYLSDKDIKALAPQAIWFMHSADDRTTRPDQTAVPVYKRLKAAGGDNIYLSYYDHVVDITGLYGGKDYWYNGHLSWIYGHANKCQLDYDGSPVLLDDRPVTIMEWMAAQRLE